jgi:hypothetical protein
MVAGDAALRAGLDTEEIEDFRIAVDELSYALMALTDDYLSVLLTPFAGHVTATGRVACRPSRDQSTLPPLSAMILGALATDYVFECARSAREATFRVTKRCRQLERARS